MNINDLQFKKLDFNGLKTLIEWAKAEGWNPSPYDAEVFWATDNDGFYGFFYDGELIAGGAIVSYNGQFGFMGLFLVKSAFRANGIGRKLWYKRRDMLLSRLEKGAAIGMDGVVAMQPFYQKGGFEIAFKDERYEKIGQAFDVHQNISTIHENDFENVLAFDKRGFGFARPQFLKPWLNMPNNHCFKFVENDILKGFAVLRKANFGYKIAPLFAENPVVAEELYKACLNAAIGETVYLDIPVINENAVNLVKKYDAKYVFECGRMYYGEPPKIDFDLVFGITSFELG